MLWAPRVRHSGHVIKYDALNEHPQKHGGFAVFNQRVEKLTKKRLKRLFELSSDSVAIKSLFNKYWPLLHHNFLLYCARARSPCCQCPRLALSFLAIAKLPKLDVQRRIPNFVAASPPFGQRKWRAERGIAKSWKRTGSCGFLWLEVSSTFCKKWIDLHFSLLARS